MKLFKATRAHKKRKIEEAIKLLNEMVKIKLAPSPIHGIGVFAMRDLKKGEKLNADAIPHAFDVPFKKFKELRPEVAEEILSHWPIVVNGASFLYPDTKRTSYLNHSETPNYDFNEDKTLTKIKKGDEILVDYKQIPNWEKVFAWLNK